jgi:hypothetical protein
LIRTIDGERQLLQLGRIGGDLPANTRRLIIHSHPGARAEAALRAISGDDIAALQALGQRSSLIVNLEGTVGRFGQSGDVEVLKRLVFGAFQRPVR